MNILLQVSVGWLLHLLTCFYIVRPIRSIVIRGTLTLIPSILLTNIGSRSLPSHQILSVFIIATYWMMTIRFIHVTILSPNEFPTFFTFAAKCLWILFPIKASQPIDRRWPILVHLVVAVVKFVLNRWLQRWLLECEANDHYMRIFTYFLSILSFSYIINIETIFIRIITGDKYTVQWLNNMPFLSQSLREFWGQRYNQIVGTILKESIFRPIKPYIASRSMAGLITFIVSGLFHVHIVLVVFRDPSSVLSTFACFFLNGIGCCIEAKLSIKFPPLVGWLLTHIFLFFTAPMCLGPFTRDESVFFEIDVLSSFADEWLSRLPVPNFCP